MMGELATVGPGGRVLFQNVLFRRLGMAKVDHLIEQLVDDYKVVPQTLLLQLAKVFGKDFHQPVQEQQDTHHIGILSRQRQYCRPSLHQRHPDSLSTKAYCRGWRAECRHS